MTFARTAGRIGSATLLVALALLAADASGARAARAGGPEGPSCAEGPVREGDTILGTPCADTIVVPETVARVNGGAGDDTIVAAAVAAPTALALGVCEPLCGVGSQVFEGGEGDDVVFGERGNDILRGNGGNDRLYGGIGDDVLEGGFGDDLLSGGFGADTIDGGEGSDYVRGDGTIDHIYDSGAAGVDTLSYASGVTPGFGGGIETGAEGFPAGASGERGVNLVLGSSGLNGNNGIAGHGGGWDEVQRGAFETIVGTAFSDYIVGTAAAETIYGGGGADVIEGGGGEDHLYGGADGDLLKAGGDPGDSADGGSGADNCLGAEVETSCEGAEEAVTPRDPSEVAVGLLAPGTSLADLYLAGSEGNDEVLASYSAGPPATVTFTLAAGTFDESSAAESECAFSGNEATCSLGSTPLDSIVLAGMGGDDRLTATGFPEDVGVAVLGGEGADEATGGADSEDLLVGGADEQPDVLSALGRDDILIHEGGPDRLYGGDGNDLFLSTSVCEGAAIVGGDGPYRDSASWARADEAVAAYLATGVVGRPGQAGCGAEPNDSLAGIEDLEGSEFGDVLIGDAGDNHLYGRGGADFYQAGAGEDTILANSGDSDAAIDCGADLDTAIVDLPQYGDPEPVECETVFQGAPGDFRHTELLRSPPEPEPEPPPPADTTPPRTRFTHHPPKVVLSGRRHRRVAFRFAANEPGSHFLCRIDRKPYRRCRSPRVFGVSVGRHAVRVRAVDAAGNVDPTPALFGFRVRLRTKRHGHHHHVRPHHRRG